MKTFDTEAALAAAHLQAGQIVRTKGKTASGDLLGDTFFVRTIAEHGAADGVLSIALANGNIAVRETTAGDLTTTALIAGRFSAVGTGAIVTTQGYAAAGDGGAAQWRKTGVTGLTSSQSPAQTGGGTLHDADGDEWGLVQGGAISVRAVGAVGDGVADDQPAIQAACDAVEALGGGVVTVPWPPSVYLLGASVEIPSNCRFICDGVPRITAGEQQFTYAGADAAFVMKDGEGVSSGSFRSIHLEAIGVELTTASATGFRLRHGRDAVVELCAVRMSADNQIGFHLQGEADGSANKGVFDVTLRRTISYTASDSYTGALHYKLSGVTSDGQVNACLFLNVRGGGSGTGVETGPSNTNSWVMPEFEALTGDGFHFLSGAFENGIHDLYIEAQSGWTGKILNVESGALRNYLDGYVAGVNVNPDDLTLQPANFSRWNGVSRDYAAAATNTIKSIRVVGDAEDRHFWRPDGFFIGDGTNPATTSNSTGRKYTLADKTAAQTDFSSADPSATPDLSVAHVHALRLQAGSSGTLTINAPSNAFADGNERLIVVVRNVSGGSINLNWSGYVSYSGDTLPASINTSDWFAAVFIRVLSNWVKVN